MKHILNGYDIMKLFDIEKNQIMNKNCTKVCIIKYISSLFNAKE